MTQVDPRYADALAHTQRLQQMAYMRHMQGLQKQKMMQQRQMQQQQMQMMMAMQRQQPQLTPDEQRRQAVQRAGIESSRQREMEMRKEKQFYREPDALERYEQQRQQMQMQQQQQQQMPGQGMFEEKIPNFSSSETPSPGAFNTVAGMDREGPTDTGAAAAQSKAFSARPNIFTGKVSVYGGPGRGFIKLDDNDERLSITRTTARAAERNLQKKKEFFDNEQPDSEVSKMMNGQIARQKAIADGSPVTSLQSRLQRDNKIADRFGKIADNERILQDMSGIPNSYQTRKESVLNALDILGHPLAEATRRYTYRSRSPGVKPASGFKLNLPKTSSMAQKMQAILDGDDAKKLKQMNNLVIGREEDDKEFRLEFKTAASREKFRKMMNEDVQLDEKVMTFTFRKTEDAREFESKAFSLANSTDIMMMPGGKTGVEVSTMGPKDDKSLISLAKKMGGRLHKVVEDVQVDEVEVNEDAIDDLIARYEKTGRTAHRYPRKKMISVDGRGMSEKDAVAKMKSILKEGLQLDERKKPISTRLGDAFDSGELEDRIKSMSGPARKSFTNLANSLVDFYHTMSDIHQVDGRELEDKIDGSPPRVRKMFAKLLDEAMAPFPMGGGGKRKPATKIGKDTRNQLEMTKPSEYSFSAPAVGGGTFAVIPIKSSRPSSQAGVLMAIFDKRGKVSAYYGTHMDTDSAKKFAKRDGLIESVNEERFKEPKKVNYKGGTALPSTMAKGRKPVVISTPRGYIVQTYNKKRDIFSQEGPAYKTRSEAEKAAKLLESAGQLDEVLLFTFDKSEDAFEFTRQAARRRLASSVDNFVDYKLGKAIAEIQPPVGFAHSVPSKASRVHTDLAKLMKQFGGKFLRSKGEGKGVEKVFERFETADVSKTRESMRKPMVKKTKFGFQVMVYSPTKKGYIAQGQPHKTKAAAEKDAKMFESVQLDEGSEIVFSFDNPMKAGAFASRIMRDKLASEVDRYVSGRKELVQVIMHPNDYERNDIEKLAKQYKGQLREDINESILGKLDKVLDKVESKLDRLARAYNNLPRNKAKLDRENKERAERVLKNFDNMVAELDRIYAHVDEEVQLDENTRQSMRNMYSVATMRPTKAIQDFVKKLDKGAKQEIVDTLNDMNLGGYGDYEARLDNVHKFNPKDLKSAMFKVLRLSEERSRAYITGNFLLQGTKDENYDKLSKAKLRNLYNQAKPQRNTRDRAFEITFADEAQFRQFMKFMGGSKFVTIMKYPVINESLRLDPRLHELRDIPDAFERSRKIKSVFKDSDIKRLSKSVGHEAYAGGFRGDKEDLPGSVKDMLRNIHGYSDNDLIVILLAGIPHASIQASMALKHRGHEVKFNPKRKSDIKLRKS
jgi:hypothetical protein